MSTILSIAIIIFESMCSKIFISGILSEKQIVRKSFYNFCIIQLSIAVPAFIISNIFENFWIKSLLIVLLYFFIMQIFYISKKLLTCLYLAVILYATIIAMDYFVILLSISIFSASSDLILSNTFFFSFAAMISKLLLFMIVITCKKIIDRNKAIQYINKKDWWILIMQSIISIVAFVAIIELSAYSEDIPIVVFFGAIGLLFSTLLVFYLLEGAARYEKDIREKAILHKQLETEMESIISLKNSYDSQRRIMHDYKNHMSTIFHMLNNEQYEDALEYVKNLTGEIYYSLYRIKTNNDIIDVILNQKDQVAQQRGIVMDIRSGDLSSLNLPAAELVTIISNVLDNAIEACEKVNVKKIITGKLVVENNMFIFSVQNPVDHYVEIINNRIQTTKDNPAIHGLGLRNVAHSLERCNGDFEMDCDGRKFQFTALVKLN